MGGITSVILTSGRLVCVCVCVCVSHGNHVRRRSALSVNMPLPFAARGTNAVHLEAWFHVGNRSVTPSCLAGKGRSSLPPGTPMHFLELNVEKVTALPLEIVAQLVDPKGSVRQVLLGESFVLVLCVYVVVVSYVSFLCALFWSVVRR